MNIVFAILSIILLVGISFLVFFSVFYWLIKVFDVRDQNINSMLKITGGMSSIIILGYASFWFLFLTKKLNKLTEISLQIIFCTLTFLVFYLLARKYYLLCFKKKSFNFHYS